MQIRENDIIFLILSEKLVYLLGYIIDIIGMRGFTEKCLESFIAAESNRALSRYSACEESYMHNNLRYNRRILWIDDAPIREQVNKI
jgi:hypothetical protein